MKGPHFVESGKFDIKCSAFNMPLCTMFFRSFWSVLGGPKTKQKNINKKEGVFLLVLIFTFIQHTNYEVHHFYISMQDSGNCITSQVNTIYLNPIYWTMMNNLRALVKSHQTTILKQCLHQTYDCNFNILYMCLIVILINHLCKNKQNICSKYQI